MHPDGGCIVTGGRRGALHRWSLPNSSAITDAVPSGSGGGGGGGVDDGSDGGSEGREGFSSTNGAVHTRSSGQAQPDLRHACQQLHLERSGHSETVDRMVRKWSDCDPKT